MVLNKQCRPRTVPYNERKKCNSTIISIIVELEDNVYLCCCYFSYFVLPFVVLPQFSNNFGRGVMSNTVGPVSVGDLMYDTDCTDGEKLNPNLNFPL